MRLPRFISHLNGIALRFFKRKQSDKQSTLSVTKKSSDIALLKDLAGKQRSTKQCLPRFISQPNEIVLRIFKRKQRNYTAPGKKTDNNAVVVSERRERSAEQRRLHNLFLLEPKKLWVTSSSTALVEFLNESISDIEMETEN